MEALPMMTALTHDVILFHDGGPYGISSPDIASVKDLFYTKIPPPPKNLKFVIALMRSSNRNMVMMAIETLDKVMYGRKLNYFVTSMEEAERLIAQADL